MLNCTGKCFKRFDSPTSKNLTLLIRHFFREMNVHAGRNGNDAFHSRFDPLQSAGHTDFGGHALYSAINPLWNHSPIQLFHDFLGNIEIRRNALHIFVIVEQFHQFEHFGGDNVVGDFDLIFGNKTQL